MPQPSPRLDDETYRRFHSLILQRSGLHFPDKRRSSLERGVAQAFTRTNSPDLEAYYQLLLSRPTDGQEWECLISLLTVGETYFFRDKAQFKVLQQHILPEIVARKQRFGRQLRIWVAGCATGEEPYSIAMLLRHHFPGLTPRDVTVLATDINRADLAQARQGQYGAWSFREQGWQAMQERYFAHQGETWRLDPQIRDMVTFAYLNLVEDAYPSLANNTVAFDLILCRNVTIYFTPEITRRVVGRLSQALVRDGWLILGHSEPAPEPDGWLRPCNFPGAVVYRKGVQPADPVPPWSREKALFAEGLSTEANRGPFMEERALPALPPQPSLEADPSKPEPPPPPPEPPPRPSTAGPDALYAQALGLLERGQGAEALERLHHIMEVEPDFARAYCLVAKIRADAGLWQEAQDWCQRALERDTLLAEAHFLLALIYSQQGDPNQALRAMKRVLYLERDAPLGHFWLANLYGELGDETRALKSLENTARLLNGVPAETRLPWSDGMTAGRLRYIVGRRLNE